MKIYRQFLSTLLLILVCSNVSLPQTWQKVLTGPYNNFYDIYFVNENVGWAVGYQGQIAKTTDGGTTWINQSVGIKKDLTGIYFFNEQKGFICGNSRYLLSTVDGGANWKVDSLEIIPNSKANNRRIIFFDELNGRLLSSVNSSGTLHGYLLSTTDGGTTWSISFEADKDFLDIDFYDQTHGIISGKDAASNFYTKDGNTWTNSAKVEFPPTVVYTRSDNNAVDMVDENTAYAVGWGSKVGAQPAILIKTTDGGATWNYLEQLTENRLYDNLYGVKFKDVENGFAFGGSSSGGSIILKTSDGGQNWIRSYIPFGSTLKNMCGVGNNTWFAGHSGLIIHTSDEGLTWRSQSNPPSNSVYSVKFVNEMTGFAAAMEGGFFKTTDGGVNWDYSCIYSDLTSYNVNEIYFVNENVGYAAQSYGKATKTTDGGLTWQTIISDTTSVSTSNYAVHFINENLGFIVGRMSSDNDIIYKTTNGGSSWNIKQNVAGKDLQDVVFYDENNGVIAGNGLKIIYTNDGGENWQTADILNVPTDLATAKLKGVCFIDASTLIAVGNKIILKSNDTGKTWEYITTCSSQLNGVVFINENTGYAVGDGELLKTTNKGDAWENVTDTLLLDDNFNAICADPAGNLWLGTGNSTIYSNKDFSSVSVNDNIITRSFDLSQNFPNPFNPSTVIKYSLKESGNVVLNVYDGLGRLVKTLVNKNQPAGEHTVSLNASEFSSGVYYYSLLVNGNILSKKMTLLK